jgi:hypothetical protein
MTANPDGVSHQVMELLCLHPEIGEGIKDTINIHWQQSRRC